jgi:ribosomal protein L7Ae-like RNA K-turn-binding protein
MKDIDNILGGKYLNAVDPLTAGLESVGKIAEAGGKVAQSMEKPDLGKLVAQRCGRKGVGYVFSKNKREAFDKCAQKVTDDWNKQYNTTATTIMSGGDSEATKSLMQQQSANTNKILIGLGIVVIGLVGYIAIKK